MFHRRKIKAGALQTRPTLDSAQSRTKTEFDSDNSTTVPFFLMYIQHLHTLHQLLC